MLETIKKMTVEDFFKLIEGREINMYDIADIFYRFHMGCDGCIGKDYCSHKGKTKGKIGGYCEDVIKYALRGGKENQDPRYALWEDKETWKFVHAQNNEKKIVTVKHRETGAEKYVLLAIDNAYIEDIPDTGWCIADYLK